MNYTFIDKGYVEWMVYMHSRVVRKYVWKPYKLSKNPEDYRSNDTKLVTDKNCPSSRPEWKSLRKGEGVDALYE